MSKPLELTVYPTWENGFGDCYADKDDHMHPVRVDFEVYRKRLTEPDLAAEVHRASAEVYRAKVHGLNPDGLIDRFMVLSRFASLPHFDEVGC